MDSKIPSIMRTVTPSRSVTSSSFTTPTSISKNLTSVAHSVKKSVNKSVVKDDGGVNIIKILLIALIVGFLVYNLYLYFTEGTDVLGKYFGIGATKGAELVVDTLAEGTKDTISAQNVVDSGLKVGRRDESPIEKATDEKKQKETDRDNINANSSFVSKLKKTVKGGYCYIGTDRTFRSCVKVDPGDTCMSNQIFPTKDICVNPNLRR